MAREITRFIGKGIDEDQAFGHGDFTIAELAPHGATVRRLHAVVIAAAWPEIHLGTDHRKPR